MIGLCAKEFLLAGNGPLANRGCEAIVLGIRKIIEKEFGPTDFLLASFADDSQATLPRNIHPVALDYLRSRWTRAWWRHQAVKLGLARDDISAFLRPLLGKLDDICASFSIGGDGYAIDYGHYIVDRLVYMDKYMKALEIPVIIWGASIGPFAEEPHFEAMMRDHLVDLDLIIVREPLSLSYLREIGIDKNVCMYPDPAFVIDAVPIELECKMMELLEEPCIGVNLSMLLARYATGGDIMKWEEKATSIIQALLSNTDMPIIMIPHVFGDQISGKMDDLSFMKSLYGELKAHEKERVGILQGDINCENLKWVISRLQALISVRMHAAIASLSSCVPCISIAYSRKTWGLNELVFSNAEWVLEASDLNPRNVCELTADLLDNRGELVGVLSKNMPDIKKDAYDAVERIGSIISNR